MTQEDLLRLLMDTFVEEVDEDVESLNAGLLALEGASAGEERVEILNGLFRTAHNLKGAARSVDVESIEIACHHMETLFDAVRSGGADIEAEDLELFFHAGDAIADAGRRLRAGEALADGPLSALLVRLDEAARATNPEAEASAPTPGSVLTETSSPPYPVETDGASAPNSPKARAPGRHAVRPAAARDTALVKVPAWKLDALLAASGELLLARHRVDARTQALDGLFDFVESWQREWRQVERIVERVASELTADAPASDRLRPDLRSVAPELELVGNNLRLLQRDLEREVVGLAQDGRILERASSGLDEEVRRVRMLPFADACRGLERAVRDLALTCGKEVELDIVGGQIEIDRSILDSLRDPLLHLVRNGIDHGVESPERREALGKARCARITVAASLRGSRIQVKVSDDGGGLDLEAVKQKAASQKLPVPQDEEEARRLLFAPGFSTATAVTEVSGRGVGLDVVATGVEALRGTVDVSSSKGGGTSFTLTLPLTLTTLRAVHVRVAGQNFFLDGEAVHRILRADKASFQTVEGRKVLSVDGTFVHVAPLARVLGLPESPDSDDGRTPMVVVAHGGQRVALTVDELIDEQDVVVKSLGGRIERVRHFVGATILPTGRIGLILSAADLIRTVSGARDFSLSASDRAGPVEKKRVVVVDDSVTVRTLLQAVLESAGYQVELAVDGAEGWEIVRQGEVDLVVADVEMPRMDGFALTRAIRGSEHHSDLPVILVTTRASEQDKKNGMQAGATAYLVKQDFDQTTLVEIITQLI